MEKRLDYSTGILYWSERWEMGESPWHDNTVNEFLIKYFPNPEVGKQKHRIFVPLCGKSQDMKWMHDQGHYVVGIEGVEQPILQFFIEHNLSCKRTEQREGLTCYSTEDGRLRIYHGDLFSIDPSILGKFDFIWDRGSLVAIYPDSDRTKYAELMKQLFEENFFYLIDTVEYDQAKYCRHPRSVPVDEITALFGDVCAVKVMEKIDLSVDQPNIPKMQWDVDKCYEIIALLTPKTLSKLSTL